VKLTTRLQLVLSSRIRGSIDPLPHTSSWRSAIITLAQGQLYLFIYQIFIPKIKIVFNRGSQVQCEAGNILWHVEPLLCNDREMGGYNKAVSGQRLGKHVPIATQQLGCNNGYGVSLRRPVPRGYKGDEV
jgi:hypothetical protein